MKIVDWRERWHDRHPVYGPPTLLEYLTDELYRDLIAHRPMSILAMSPTDILRAYRTDWIEQREADILNS